MTDTAEPENRPKSRPGRSLLVSLVLAAVLGGGGFFAVHSGVLSSFWGKADGRAAALPDMAFVPIDQILVSLGEGGQNRHLRLGATLEVDRRHQGEVQQLMPRILDVLNGYLRALETRELTDPGTLTRLRAQMLRRIQIVTGEGRVRDLLVTEFVLN